MKTIIFNIGTLTGILPEGKVKLEGSEMNHVESIENAYLVIEDGIITDFGQIPVSRGSGFQNNPSHFVGPDHSCCRRLFVTKVPRTICSITHDPCGQGGSTVFKTAFARSGGDKIRIKQNQCDRQFGFGIAEGRDPHGLQQGNLRQSIRP